MGRKKLNDHPESLKAPIAIMKDLHASLDRFLSNEMNLKVFKDDNLKSLKDLRKDASTLKDELETCTRDIEKDSHAIASGSTRFANQKVVKEVVSKFLSSDKVL